MQSFVQHVGRQIYTVFCKALCTCNILYDILGHLGIHDSLTLAHNTLAHKTSLLDSLTS